MYVLLTRPRADAERSAARLAVRGHRTLMAPVIEIAQRPEPLDLPPHVQGVLVTSANGLAALERKTHRRDLRIFAVGPASAEAARAAGFGAVVESGGDVEALSATVSGAVSPEAGPLLHVCGRDVAGDLAGELHRRGFEVVRAMLYEARPVASLPPEAVAALRAQPDGVTGVEAVLLYSERTARLFAELLRGAGLEDALSFRIVGCLSANVARGLGGLAAGGLPIAPAPHEASLFEAVGL